MVEFVKENYFDINTYLNTLPEEAAFVTTLPVVAPRVAPLVLPLIVATLTIFGAAI
jgi:hypothetical protein